MHLFFACLQVSQEGKPVVIQWSDWFSTTWFGRAGSQGKREAVERKMEENPNSPHVTYGAGKHIQSLGSSVASSIKMK